MRVTTQQLREPRVQLLAEGRRQRETPSWERAGRLIYRGNLRGVAAINVHNRLGARFVDRRKTCELVCRCQLRDENHRARMRLGRAQAPLATWSHAAPDTFALCRTPAAMTAATAMAAATAEKFNSVPGT